MPNKSSTRAYWHNGLIGQACFIRAALRGMKKATTVTPHGKDLVRQIFVLNAELITELRKHRVEADGTIKNLEK